MTRILGIVLFLAQIIVLAVFSAPVRAEDAPGELLVPPTVQESADLDLTELESVSVGSPVEGAELSSVTGVIGDACNMDYWIVSSRCAVQDIREVCSGRWGLDVYHRAHGKLCRSSMAELSQSLIPSIPVCIFSHGTFVTWESQYADSQNAYRILRRSRPNQPLQVIFFTWPSDGPYTMIAPVDITVRGRRAEFNGFHMAHLISQVPESCPLSLIGHSHGARLMLSATHLIGGGQVLGHAYPYRVGHRHIRIIVAAAAFDHDWLNRGERYGCALNRVECMLNLRNQCDVPLRLYPFTRPFARRAFGQFGLSNRDAERIGPNVRKIREINVAPLLQGGHQWYEYYLQPRILGEMLPYIYF